MYYNKVMAKPGNTIFSLPDPWKPLISYLKDQQPGVHYTLNPTSHFCLPNAITSSIPFPSAVW